MLCNDCGIGGRAPACLRLAMQANLQGLGDQVRGQKGSEIAMFGRGTELQVRCDPAPKVPSAEDDDILVHM